MDHNLSLFLSGLLAYTLLLTANCLRPSPLFEASGQESEITDQGLNIQLDKQFGAMIFGAKAKSVYISPKGALIIDDQVSVTENTEFPRQWASDPSAIVPYLSDVYVNPSSRTKIVFGRITGAINTDITNWINQNDFRVGSGSDDLSSFNPTEIFSVSWIDAHKVKSAETNTFQVVVAYDQNRTYVILNYAALQYTQSGSGGVFAKAGFNIGQHKAFKSLPWSGTEQISNLASRQATGSMKGRWLFDITNEYIINLHCVMNDAPYGPLNALEIYPRQGPYLGGNIVKLFGPHPNVTSANEMTCKFGSSNSSGWKKDQNARCEYRCQVPVLPKLGPIDFHAVLNSNSFGVNQPAQYMSYDDGFPSISIAEGDFKELHVTPESAVTLEWPPATYASFVNLELWGFTGTAPMYFQKLTDIQTGIRARGSLRFKLSEVSCKEVSACKDFSTGVFRIVDSNSAMKNRAIWSKPIALGWYKNAVMSALTPAWSLDKCNAWSDSENGDISWMDQVPSCPCTKDQAYADFARFVPDPLCQPDMSANEKGVNCRYHPEAEACFRSIDTSKGGSQCCYLADGSLMDSRHDTGAGTSDKVHIFGGKNKLPIFSFFQSDVVPYYDCCVYNQNQCALYYNNRRTKMCHSKDISKSYSQLIFASVFGDPHTVTFGGYNFTLPLEGEFDLVRMDDKFSVQGRFVKSGDRTSRLSALAVSCGKNTVTAYARHVDDVAPSVPYTDVYLNQELIRFAPNDMHRMYTANGVWLVDTDNEILKNFTIIYPKKNIAIRVSVNKRYMSAIVAVPQSKERNIIGGVLLMGENIKTSDQEYRNQEAYELAQKEKIASIATSLFAYSPSAKFDKINAKTFNPSFFTQTPISAEAKAMCRQVSQCEYDYYMTKNNRDIALHTASVYEHFSFVDYSARQSRSCPLIDVPGGGAKLKGSNKVGGVLQLESCLESDKQLSGRTEYRCTEITSAEGTKYFWNPTPHVSCLKKSQQEAFGQKPISSAVVIIIVLIVMLAITGVITACCYMKRRKKGSQKYKPTQQEMEHGDAHTGEKAPLQTTA